MTLAIMGALSISMFLGISLLTRLTHVVFEESAERTVIAQIAHAAFGGSPLFYVVQAMTAAILILAANTAFQGFPRLASVLAEDGFMPHQFNNLGDRLAFSNGIVILALFASLLIFIFDARLTSLIQLYLVGVFLSFTLSQWGMVLHWRKNKEGNWRRNLWLQGAGGAATALVPRRANYRRIRAPLHRRWLRFSSLTYLQVRSTPRALPRRAGKLSVQTLLARRTTNPWRRCCDQVSQGCVGGHTHDPGSRLRDALGQRALRSCRRATGRARTPAP